MAWISKADYETVEVTCEHCGSACIFNRREDFPHVGPYAGESVSCPNCRREFHILGDTINPPYDLFIFAAKEHFGGKRYMLAVAAMAQGWELFFGMFAKARFLYRPFFSSSKGVIELDKLNAIEGQLARALRKFTFYPMRNPLINVVVDDIAPRTLDEAADVIGRIGCGMGNDPSEDDLRSVADPETREILQALFAVGVCRLRNDAFHHRASRPSRSEVQRCLEDEVLLLYRAKCALGVRSFDEMAAGM
jgi:hypothetical protein